MKKPEFLLKKTYLQMIKNSPGTKIFRNLFVLMDGQEKDVAKDGDLSCAIFVSFILKVLDLVSLPHATVESLIKDMLENNWKEVSEPKEGDILLWEKKEIGGSINEHVGFYIGDNKAVSNNYKEKTPIVHHYTYDNTRKIIKIFRREI